MWWTTDGWALGWSVLMVSGMIAFWSLLVLGVIAVARKFGGTPPAARAAEQALAERFASGEIDFDEYGERVAALRRSAA